MTVLPEGTSKLSQFDTDYKYLAHISGEVSPWNQLAISVRPYTGSAVCGEDLAAVKQ